MKAALLLRRLFYISNFKSPISNLASHGTGSCPCPPQGWHRSIRLIASHSPLNGPYFFNASTAYCEQVGVNLHLGPSIGESTHWYSLINPINGKLSMLSIVFIYLLFKFSQN